jgi:type I restriction enzyme S subunit
MIKETRIGIVPDGFRSFILREKLRQNDAGDWGAEPGKNACGVLRSTNFTNEGVLNLDDVALRSLSETKRREKALREGDIIIERSGGSDNQPVGRVGYITANISERGYSFSNFIQRITLDDSMNAKFVFYCLQRMHEMGVTLGMQTQTTGIRNLDYKFYIRSRLPEPDRAEQDRVVIVLESVDSAIAKVRENIAKAERLQKGLMQQLLTGRLKPDGTPRRLSEFWEHPKVGFVSKGWEVSKLKQLAVIQRGKFSHRPRNDPRFYGGPYPFIQTGDVSNSRGYIVEHAQTLSEEGIKISRRFPKGTIFISIVGVNVAKTAIASYDVYATDSVIGMIPKDNAVSEYLEFYLRSIQQKIAMLSGDSARENLNYGILRPLLVAHPSDPEEQRQVADVLCSCEALIRGKEQKIAALQRLKKSLMQNLLTGRIRLPLSDAVPKRITA